MEARTNLAHNAAPLVTCEALMCRLPGITLDPDASDANGRVAVSLAVHEDTYGHGSGALTTSNGSIPTAMLCNATITTAGWERHVQAKATRKPTQVTSDNLPWIASKQQWLLTATIADALRSSPSLDGWTGPATAATPAP